MVVVGLSKTRALMLLVPVYIAVAMLSTAVTANVFDWGVTQNGACSGAIGILVCLILYPKLTKPKKNSTHT